jgi:hypothetical protein
MTLQGRPMYPNKYKAGWSSVWQWEWKRYHTIHYLETLKYWDQC